MIAIKKTISRIFKVRQFISEALLKAEVIG